MHFSDLQRYILLTCFEKSAFRIDRGSLLRFYEDNGKARQNLRTKIITQSLESLIDREFLLGYGVRTPHKWFIREVQLTAKGQREARKLLGKQLSLPLKKHK